MANLVGEFAGFVAIGISFLIYWQNDRKKLLFFKLIVDLLWSTHFLFIGGYTAMLTTVISIFREILFVNREKCQVLKKRIVPVIFCFFYILAAIFTWKGVQSLLPVIASCLATIAFYHDKVNKIRVWSLLSSVLMFFNGIACHSIANIVNEVITVSSIISGTIRSKKLEKE